MLVCSILCNNLKKALPNSEIHYMVYESTATVLRGNKNIDKLILFTDKERKSKVAFFRFLMRVRREKYDVLIDSYSKIESWLTTLFSNANRKISYRKPGRNFLYTDLVNTYDAPLSNLGLIIERRLSLLDPLNLDVDIDPVPKLHVTEDEQHFALKLFEDLKVDRSRKSIMISLLGSSAIKTYPLHYMSKLIDFIAERADVNLLFNYMQSQAEEAREIYNACQPETRQRIYFDLIGSSIREYIAIMNECDLIIGNDGGAINMAKAMNKPSFIIFSPWIRREMWATFEDGQYHRSVHLQQFKPGLFEGKSEKELKKNALAIYQDFKPEYIYSPLQSFLDYNLNNAANLDIPLLARHSKSTARKSLSALIIVKNEAKNIPALITNLQFADEIIIVDSLSDDKTEEIIKGYPNVTFVEHEFQNFSDQRNFAIAQANHQWVLFIDADERIPKSLQYEIQKALESNEEFAAYEIYRQFYFCDKPLKYGGFQTDKVIRLFDKGSAYYDESKLVHETLIVNGSTSELKSKLLHFSYEDEVSYKQKLISYAKLRAKELQRKKLSPNVFHLYVKPWYRFLYQYIIRRGFLDGRAGYIIAKINAFGVKQRFVELQKLVASQP